MPKKRKQRKHPYGNVQEQHKIIKIKADINGLNRGLSGQLEQSQRDNLQKIIELLHQLLDLYERRRRSIQNHIKACMYLTGARDTLTIKGRGSVSYNESTRGDRKQAACDVGNARKCREALDKGITNARDLLEGFEAKAQFLECQSQCKSINLRLAQCMDHAPGFVVFIQVLRGRLQELENKTIQFDPDTAPAVGVVLGKLQQLDRDIQQFVDLGYRLPTESLESRLDMFAPIRKPSQRQLKKLTAWRNALDFKRDERPRPNWATLLARRGGRYPSAVKRRTVISRVKLRTLLARRGGRYPSMVKRRTVISRVKLRTLLARRGGRYPSMVKRRVVRVIPRAIVRKLLARQCRTQSCKVTPQDDCN